MADFMMLMKSAESDGDWDAYIMRLRGTGMFRGGSVLGKGVCVKKGCRDGPCIVRGFMRFEADTIDEVRALLEGNPVYEAGGEVELLELVPDS